jgi:hypothetical protein
MIKAGAETESFEFGCELWFLTILLWVDSDRIPLPNRY